MCPRVSFAPIVMKIWKTLIAAGFLAVAFAHAGQGDHERARQALAAGEILPLRQVLDRVEREVSGQVLEVELEDEHGTWVYEIKVLGPKGAVAKLKVDARDGKILRKKGHELPGEQGSLKDGR